MAWFSSSSSYRAFSNCIPLWNKTSPAFFQLRFKVLGKSFMQYTSAVWKDVGYLKSVFSSEAVSSLRWCWCVQIHPLLTQNGFVKLFVFHTQTSMLTVPTSDDHGAVQTKRRHKSEEKGFGENHLVEAIKTPLSCKCHSLPRVGLHRAGRGPPYLEPLSNWKPD